MKMEILRETEQELCQSIEYYEDIEPGLGVRLKEEVRQHLGRIVADPLLARLRIAGYRRVNLKVFPFYIAYYIADKTIWVVAIAHTHRRPEYWSKRRNR